MTAIASPATRARIPLLRGAFNFLLGSLLCLTPLTALIVLGWLSRRMTARIDRRFGRVSETPGWVLGPKGKGWMVRLLGGFASNIRAGVIAAVGLAALTLPFTMLWLGAWWAGWENSFNKGYEQSAVGPVIWFLGALISLPILTLLPISLAHASAERRLGAFFEYRRIRSIVRAAGWRVPWLAVLSIIICIPFLGLRTLPVFVEGLVPGFADMATAEQQQVAQAFDLAGAALAFLIVLFLRDRASSIYARALPCAARGRAKPIWLGHFALAVPCNVREPSRLMSAFWFLLACTIWAGLPGLIVVGQFMNYSALLWLTHPVFLLPWTG